MIRGRKLVALAAVLGGMTLLVAAGGAGASLALAGARGADALRAAPAPAIDLSSSASIHRYLRSIHVDPRTVVIQRGSHNYAGPNCPGSGWNCTTSHRVVQVASRLASRSLTAVNNFQCTPTSAQQPATDSGTGTCVLIQSAPGPSATNQSASCNVTANDSAALECSITQLNPTGGNNSATVQMTINDSTGNVQTADEQANVSQSSTGKGNNSVSIGMSIILATAETSAGAQAQDAHNWLNLTQSTNGGSGNNSAAVSQKQSLTEKFSNGASVTQTQDTSPASMSSPCTSGGQSDPAVCIVYDQETGTGTNSLSVGQNQSLSETASGVPAAAVSQTQGCGTPGAKDCGIEESGYQSTSPPGSNKDAVNQTGSYKMAAPPGATQNQDPRIGGEGTSQCCGANDSFNLQQTGKLSATGPLDTQDQQNVVDDFSDGKINTKSNITTNDASSTFQCSGSGSCFYEQECGNVGEGGFCPPNMTFTAGGGEGGSLARRR